MTKVDSTVNNNFLQDNPPPGMKNSRGWKSWRGYLNEAKQLAICLLKNAKYSHEAVVSFDVDLTQDQHRFIWQHVVRKLKASKVTGIWIRELTKTGRIHYHLLFHGSKLSKETIETAIPEAFRSVSRVHFDAVRDQFQMCFYFCKAKLSGIDSKTGQYAHDKWFDKRRIFCKSTKLDKTGSFNSFWKIKKEVIWQAVIAKEKLIAANKTDDNHELAVQLSKLVEGEVGISTIERNLAIHIIKENIQGITGEIIVPDTTILYDSNTITTNDYDDYSNRHRFNPDSDSQAKTIRPLSGEKIYAISEMDGDDSRPTNLQTVQEVCDRVAVSGQQEVFSKSDCESPTVGMRHGNEVAGVQDHQRFCSDAGTAVDSRRLNFRWIL